MTESERKRYTRQLMLPEIGEPGQEKISDGKVLVVGTGGLGSPVLYYLAAAGIGTIGIMDSDTVDISNLQRQIMHTTPEIGVEKTTSAARKLSLLNPGINIVAHPFRLTAENGADIIAGYDFIVDATDNIASKYLINDLCTAADKAFSHGAINGLRGHTFTYTPGAPCLRCLFGMDKELHEIGHNPPVGVLGTITGIIGSIQATEAIKFLTGSGRLLTGRILSFNAAEMNITELSFGLREGCRCH